LGLFVPAVHLGDHPGNIPSGNHDLVGIIQGGYGMIQPKARQKIFFIIQPLIEFIVR